MALGGASDNYRRLFGVYDDRVIHLNSIPSTIDYTVKASSFGAPIREAGTDAIVQPWNIRPGKWLRILDASLAEVEIESGEVLYLGGSASQRELRQHPSLIFIESITFTAPYDFALNGGKTDTVSAQIAKLAFGN